MDLGNDLGSEERQLDIMCLLMEIQIPPMKYTCWKSNLNLIGSQDTAPSSEEIQGTEEPIQWQSQNAGGKMYTLRNYRTHTWSLRQINCIWKKERSKAASAYRLKELGHISHLQRKGLIWSLYQVSKLTNTYMW